MNDLPSRPPVTTWRGWLMLPVWVVATFIRELLVGPWRTGSLSWRGRPVGERVVLGFMTVLFAACVAVVAGSSWLRRSTAMVAWSAPDGDLVSVPTWVMFLVSVSLAVSLAAMLAWSAVTHPATRGAIVAGYVAIPMLLVSFCWATASPAMSAVAAVLFAAPAVAALVRAGRWWDPSVVFAVSSLCIASGIAVVWWALSSFAGQVLPLEPVALVLALLVTMLPAATAPVAFAAALATVDFGLAAVRAASGLASMFLGRFLAVGVVALAGWRVADAFRSTPGGWSAVGQSTLFVALAAAAWFGCGAVARARGAVETNSATHEMVAVRPLAFNVGFAMFVPLFAASFAYLVSTSVSVLRPGSAAADRITGLGGWLSDATTTLVVRSIVAVVLVAAVCGYTATGRARLAQWSAMFAVVLGVSLLSARGAVLAEWRWSEVGIDRVMLAGVVVLAVVQVARRSVTPSFVTHAGSLVVVGALFSQSGFVSDPLGALFGFAGLGFLVFGLVWGFVTGGAEVKSASTPIEATARLVGMLGRSLFSVVVIAWAVAARQTELSAQLPAFTELGRTTVGTGVLVGISLWLFGAAAGWDIDPRLTADAEERAPAATATDELPDTPVLSPA